MFLEKWIDEAFASFVKKRNKNKEICMSLFGLILAALIKSLLFIIIVLTVIAYTTILERKGLGHIQQRYGPNRVGPFGLLQPLADGLKLIVKEDVVVPFSNKLIYIVAPIIVVSTALLPYAVVPFADKILPDVIHIFGKSVSLAKASLNKGVIADINIGLLYIIAVSSLGVYGVILGGWASNSKYSLLGGIRAAAQMISYELPLGLSLIGVIMIAKSLSLVDIVEAQKNVWFLWYQPIGFIIFLICGFAETFRTPFDLIECENELVAGYQTEYSSMKFGMFYLGEFAHYIFVSCLIVTLYFGGWNGPFLPPIVWFLVKIFFFIFLFIWIRGTYPRLRYDQLMALGWKFLIPLAFLNIILTSAVMLYV